MDAWPSRWAPVNFILRGRLTGGNRLRNELDGPLRSTSEAFSIEAQIVGPFVQPGFTPFSSVLRGHFRSEDSEDHAKLFEVRLLSFRINQKSEATFADVQSAVLDVFPHVRESLAGVVPIPVFPMLGKSLFDPLPSLFAQITNVGEANDKGALGFHIELIHVAVQERVERAFALIGDESGNVVFQP